MQASTFVALDVLSMVLCVAVAAGFLWVLHWSRQGLHAQVAAGFTLLGTGYFFVAMGHFSGGDGDLLNVARLFLQMTGVLTLLLAYADYHGAQRPHPLAVAVGAVGGATALAAVLYIIPPFGLHVSPAYFATAYAMMALAFLGCTLLSGYGWHRRPTWGRAMVPLAFLFLTFSSYTWVIISISPSDAALPIVYAWRLAALGLMLWATVRRPRVPSTRLSDAPT